MGAILRVGGIVGIGERVGIKRGGGGNVGGESRCWFTADGMRGKRIVGMFNAAFLAMFQGTRACMDGLVGYDI